MDFNFSPTQAEWITERLLESREAYVNLERFLRGDITRAEFNLLTNFLIESLQSDFKREQELVDEAV